MIEREGLVEEPGQDKDTNKIKEGTVEEDGKNLTPFDFTIIGTPLVRNIMFEVANSPLKMRTKTNPDSKNKGKDEARKSWASCTNNISANNSYSS